MNTRNSLKSKESPIMLGKILSESNNGAASSREPNLLASPNAFDWEKRLALPGGSPNAFALSLNANESAVTNAQLFDYPGAPQSIVNTDLSTIMLMDQMNQAAALPQDHHPLQGSMNPNESFVYTDSPSSISTTGPSNLFESLPSKRSTSDRRDSHRESERRRRETFKAAMFHLENLVVLTLNRGGSCKVLGKGPNRKLAHAEVYKMARDIIVTLKEEIAKVELMNHEISMKLSMNSE